MIICVSETVKNEVKEQNARFQITLDGTLVSGLLENMLAGKGVIPAGKGKYRAGQDV